jgi:hypothetical protein
VPDAVLAAIAFEHGCAIATLDRDFARFTVVPRTGRAQAEQVAPERISARPT